MNLCIHFLRLHQLHHSPHGYLHTSHHRQHPHIHYDSNLYYSPHLFQMHIHCFVFQLMPLSLDINSAQQQFLLNLHHFLIGLNTLYYCLFLHRHQRPLILHLGNLQNHIAHPYLSMLQRLRHHLKQFRFHLLHPH